MERAITSTSDETVITLRRAAAEVDPRLLPAALGSFGALLATLCVVGIATMFPAAGASFQPLAALAEVALGVAGLLFIQAAMEARAQRATRPVLLNAALALSASFALIGLTSFDAATSTVARRGGILIGLAGALAAGAAVLSRQPSAQRRAQGGLAAAGAALILLATGIAYGTGGPPATLLWLAGFIEVLGAAGLLLWAVAAFASSASPRAGGSAAWLGAAGLGIFGVALFATGLDATLGMKWDAPDVSGMPNWVAIVATNIAAVAALAAGGAIAAFGVMDAARKGAGAPAMSEPARSGPGVVSYVDDARPVVEEMAAPHGGVASRAQPSAAAFVPASKLRTAGNILLGSGVAGALLTLLPWVTVTVFITFTANPWFISGGGETSSWWSSEMADGPAAVGLIRALGPGLLVGTALVAAAGWYARQGTPKRNLALAGAGIYGVFVILGVVAATQNADNGVTLGSWSIGLWGSIAAVGAMAYAIWSMHTSRE